MTSSARPPARSAAPRSIRRTNSQRPAWGGMQKRGEVMMHEAQPVRDDRSLGELFGELTREISTLVRQEAALARAELSQKASRLGKDIGMLAAGAAVAYAGLLALLAALIIGLAAAGLPGWLAALVVGLIVVAAGGLLIRMGLRALKQ